VKLADDFLDSGPVVATSGNPDKTYPEGIDVFREYRADVPGTVTRKPVAILVDSGTASAAELFAGAVWNSAFVIGDRTFGKGIGQTQMPIGERTNGLGGSLILTTFRYRFPDGYAPQGRGISPHVLEPDPELAPLVARRGSEGMKTFLREEDFGPQGIPSDGSSRDSKPAGHLGDLVGRLGEDPPDLEDSCAQTADCQLERALAYVERFAAMGRGVDRQARSF
jgi:hypothetical protein